MVIHRVAVTTCATATATVIVMINVTDTADVAVMIHVTHVTTTFRVVAITPAMDILPVRVL
jgi:hypothetical protein